MSEERIFKKLTCKKCGGYYEAKYSNHELMIKFPYNTYDQSYRNLRNKSKFIKHKRELKCPNCEHEKTISRKLLMQISKLKIKENGK